MCYAIHVGRGTSGGKGIVTSFNMDRAAIDAAVLELTALVEQIKTKQGSQAKLLENATHEALGQVVTFKASAMPKAPKFNEPSKGKGSVNLGELAQFIADVNAFAENLRNETVSVILKKSGDGTNIDALKELYATKRETLNAMLIVAKAMGVEVDGVEIPQLRAARATSTPRKSGKYGQWYRIVNGVRKDQSNAQNSLSSFAYWHSAKMFSAERLGAGPFEAALRAAGVESPMGKSWALEINGVTYGMDVIDHPTSEDKTEEE